MERRNFLKAGALGSGLVLTAPAMMVFETGCNTNWITVVENDIPVVLEIVNSVLQVITIATGSGALAAGVGAVVTTAINALVASLNAFADAFNAYTSSKSPASLGKVIAALEAAQNDVQAVINSLPAGSVSTTVQTIIVAGIGTVITILSAIQALLPGAAPAALTAHAQAGAVGVVLPNAAALKTGFNAVVMLHGYGGAEVK